MAQVEMHQHNDPIGTIATVGEFWQWAFSDMLVNTNRGVLAEFIVGKLLGIDMSFPRTEWDCYDLVYKEYTIEVKSSAYIQKWHTPDRDRSKPSFDIKMHDCEDPFTGVRKQSVQRWADAYVFCIFPSTPQSDIRDVLDLDEWRFFATTTKYLESCIPFGQRSISINPLRKICGDELDHTELKSRIDSLLL